MKQSYPRCRRARFKDGRVIEVLTNPREDMSLKAKAQLDHAIMEAWDRGIVAGVALLVWYTDGETFTHVHNMKTSPYLASMLPSLIQGSFTTDIMDTCLTELKRV